MNDDQQNTATPPKSGAKAITKWIKSDEAIEGMKTACKANAMLMDTIRPQVKPGISTGELDRMIHQITCDNGFIPACLNYRGFPKSSCISVNEVVCHGVPGNGIILKEGDIVNLDLTTIVDGFFGDQSETFMLEPVSPGTKELVRTAANALIEGIACVQEGTPFSRIGEVIENYVRPSGFSVVVDYTGHGIGSHFHEEPPIYHFKNTETAGFLMAPGMTFTIEPMINQGTWRVEVDPDDHWTVRTLDRMLSAQFEHTILVTPKGFDILTLTPSQLEAGKICFLADHEKNNIDTRY